MSVTMCDRAGWHEAHPATLAAPLAVAGMGLARQGRVLMAEGVLRKAAGALHLDATTTDPAFAPKLFEADFGARSVAALACWRLGQLYIVMPKRGSEAERWLDLAHHLWPFKASESSTIEWQLGDRGALGGEGKAESACVGSLALRRLFRCEQT